MTVLLTVLHRSARVITIMFIITLAGQAAALDDAEIVDSMNKATAIAIGRSLSDAENAELAAQTARAIAADRATVVGNLPVIAESALAMRRTENAAAQGVLYDTLRQLLHGTYSSEANPIALQLMVPDDLLMASHQPGMGLAYTDVYAAGWLRALYQGRFSHPDEVTLTRDELTGYTQEFLGKFSSGVPENQQVMSRLNAWAAGVRKAWPTLSPEERRIATAFSTEEAIPSETVVEKVTGTRDFIKWVAGMDLGLDAEAQSAYPALVEYHASGRTAEAMAALFGRLGAGDQAATWSEFQSLQMLQNLNNYYANGGLLSGGDAGGIMLGLE